MSFALVHYHAILLNITIGSFANLNSKLANHVNNGSYIYSTIPGETYALTSATPSGMISVNVIKMPANVRVSIQATNTINWSVCLHGGAIGPLNVDHVVLTEITSSRLAVFKHGSSED